MPLSESEKDQIFSSVFGGTGTSTVLSPPEKVIPSATEKNKIFADIFGYDPGIEEPPEVEPMQVSEDVRQPAAESTDRESVIPVVEPKRSGVTRSFDTEPDQIPFLRLDADPKVAAIESRFFSIQDPRARALELKSLPQDKGALMLQKLPEEERASVKEQLQTLVKEDREANAFAVGILNSTPVPTFLPEEAKQEIAETMQAAPVRAAAGQIAGTVGQAILGSQAIGGLLSKTPIANSPLLKTALTRLTVSGGIAAEQNIGRKDIGEAIGDVAQQAGGGLFSLVPEILVSPGGAQIIAQPLGDLIYDVAVGTLRGQDIASKKWWKDEAISLASSLGFAIKDVASGKTFEMEQAAQREELRNLLKKKPDADLQFEMPKERSDKLNTLIRQNLDATQTPAKSKVIADEAPQFESPLTKLYHVGHELNVGEGLVPDHRGLVWFSPSKDKYGASKAGVPKTEIRFPADKLLTENKADWPKILESSDGSKEGIFKAAEKEGYEAVLRGDDVSMRPETAEKYFKQFQSRMDVMRNVRKPPTELDLKTTIDAEGNEPYINRYEQQGQQEPIGTTSGDVRAETVSPDAGSQPGRPGEGPAARPEADLFAGREDLASLTPESADLKIDQKIAEELDALDRLAKTTSEGDINAEGDGTRPEARVEQTGEVGRPPEEAGRVGEGSEEPVRVRDTEEVRPESVDLPERRRGIFSEVGGGGGPKQKRLTDVSADPEVQKLQADLDKQREDVRKAFVKPFKERLRNFIDKAGEKTIDRAYYAKRVLGDSPEAKYAIGKLNASKSASAEAKMQYDEYENSISKNLPHELEHSLEDLLQAKRIVEIENYKGEGKVKHTYGTTKAEQQKIIDVIENQYPKKEADAIRTAERRYRDAMTDQLQQLKDAGLLSEESFTNLKEKGMYYSPRKFIQHIDPEYVVNQGGQKVSVRDSGIKSLDEGSEQAMVKNWRLLLSEVVGRTQSRIAKNKASSALAEYVRATPDNSLGFKIEDKISQDVPTGMERIYFTEEGQGKAVLVPIKFAESWNQTDQAMNAAFAKALNIVSGGFILRPLATGALAPEFALSNVPRDFALQWLTTKEYSKVAPVAILQTLDNFRKVFKDAWTGGGRYRDYVRQGGGMEFLNEQGSVFFKDPTKTMTPSIERNRHIFEAMHKFQEVSERLTRLALREQAIKNGKSPEEATRIAREYLDFAQGGSWTKALNNAVPYLNAGVQGTRSLARSLKNDPGDTSLKALQLMLMGGAVAYTANQFFKDEWREISDREKVSRWNYPIGMKYTDASGRTRHAYLSLPKDQSSRVFATIGETIVDRMNGNIDGKQAWARMQQAFSDLNPVDLVGLTPPSLSAILGYALNKDFWSREDIWKGRDVSPHLEYMEGRTPNAYIDIANQLSKIGVEVSPARTHTALRRVIPANPITALMGGAYNQVTGRLNEKDKSRLDKSMLEQLSKTIGVRKFLRSTTGYRPDASEIEKDLIKYREKEAEGREIYKTDIYNEAGKIKSERELEYEARKVERRLSDVRQQFDNRARIVSKIFLAGDLRKAQEEWDALQKDAKQTIGAEEVKRLGDRIRKQNKK